MSHEHHQENHTEHHHEHNHDADCDCHSCRQGNSATVKTVDGSVVGSLSFEVSCEDCLALEQRITEELFRVSRILEADGGIVGHAKAAFEQTFVSKISVIDDQSTINRVTVPVAKGDLVVIAFLVSEDLMCELLGQIDFS